MEYPKNVFLTEMAAVCLDLFPVSTFDVGDDTATVGPRWVKLFSYYIQAKAVANDGQKKVLLFHCTI